MGEQSYHLQCTINGHEVNEMVDPSSRLLDFLRERMFLTGAKEGCGKGECGACTVFLDGKPVDSCLVMTIQIQGHKIVTIEGMAREGRLDVVQQTLLEDGAVQCGFCIPGMVMSARALLDEKDDPTIDDVRLALGGNVCRCTGYHKILNAVLRAAKVERQMKKEQEAQAK